MSTPDERLSELIAAAVADELTPAERTELDALRLADPAIDLEIDELRAMMASVSSAAPEWTDAVAGDALKARILAEVDQPVDPPVAIRRRRWLLPAVSAACLVVGVGVGLVGPQLLSAPPTGPPGTLGAIEHIDLREDLPTGTIDADLVAHTWGTEAVVDATGLDVGTTYSVVLVGTDGTEFSAGEMLGSPVAIHCSLNAAVLREDVARLEVRVGDGIVATADLPRA